MRGRTATAAAPYRRTAGEVLAELDREDFLTLGADGTIRAAYPFSATQTPHRVRIAGASCCDALNFFTSTASARTWAREHPDVTGTVVGQARAEEIGRQIFGALLTDG
jgi:hypothetical protein